MSSESEPKTSTAAEPVTGTGESEHTEKERPAEASAGTPSSGGNGDGPLVVAELGTLEIDETTALEEAAELKAEPAPEDDKGEPTQAKDEPRPPSSAPDPSSNGSGPADPDGSATDDQLRSGVAGGASNSAAAAASAASVAVASAVSATADRLSSAGAAARSFGQVIAASLATPPAGVPLLRRERRMRREPSSPPAVLNPFARTSSPPAAPTGPTAPTAPVTPDKTAKPVEAAPAAADATSPLPRLAAPLTGLSSEMMATAPTARTDSEPVTARTIETPPIKAPPTEKEPKTATPSAPKVAPVPQSADAATTTTLPPVPAIGPAPITPVRRRPRRARLKVTRLDPWTVMKVAFLLSLAAGIMTVVAVAVLWSVLDSANVFSEVGSTLREVTGGDQGDGFDLEEYLSLGRVLTFTGIVAGIEVIVLTALTTLGAFLYNVSARMAGGVEVTLAEDD